MALQSLATQLANFAETFTTKELIATNITAHRITADELCAGSVCVTEAQLSAQLRQPTAPNLPKSGPSPPSNIRELNIGSKLPSPEERPDALARFLW